MKKAALNVLFLPALVACSLFTACSGPLDGGPGGRSSGGSGSAATGSFSITIGSGSRAALPWDNSVDTSDLDHTIILTGPGPGQKQEGVRDGETAYFSVIPGLWNITVEAYLGEELIAVGIASVNIESGSNNVVPVSMGQPPVLKPGLYAKLNPASNDTPISTVPANDVAAAIDYVNNNPVIEYTLLLGEDVTCGEQRLKKQNFNLTIEGIGKPRTITPNRVIPDDILFFLQNGASLTLGNNIILTSTSANPPDSLINIYDDDCRLTMLKGSKITGSTVNYFAVHLLSGVFVMEEGSEITGNIIKNDTLSMDYAVYAQYGQLLMNGGSITGNSNSLMPADVVIYDKSCEIMLSGAASIGSLTLFADSDGKSSVSVYKGWTGNVAALNLYGLNSFNTVPTDLWEDEIVVKAVPGYSLTTGDIGKFTLGEFLWGDSSGNNQKQNIIGDYKIELVSGEGILTKQ